LVGMFFFLKLRNYSPVLILNQDFHEINLVCIAPNFLNSSAIKA
jgi:hypothetical protein